MSKYVDVDIIENSKVIGTAKMYKGETKAEKGLEKRLGTMGYLNIQNVQKPYTDGFTDGMQEREKENAQLRADYEKQKEINKELVDDIAALQRDKADLIFVRDQKAKHICELKARITELETQIKLGNEQEARDIRTRFPC